MADKKLEARVVAFCKAATKQMATLRALAQECLEHAATHGDATALFKLVTGLPSTYRVEALVLWITAFSPIRFITDDDGQRIGVRIIPTKSKMYVPFDTVGAAAQPFDTFTKENEVKPLDYAALERLVQAFKKRYNTAKNEGKVVEADDAKIAARLAILEQAMAQPLPAAAVIN